MASVPAWQLSRKRHFCEWVEWKGHGHTERTHLEPANDCVGSSGAFQRPLLTDGACAGDVIRLY